MGEQVSTRFVNNVVVSALALLAKQVEIAMKDCNRKAGNDGFLFLFLFFYSFATQQRACEEPSSCTFL